MGKGKNDGVILTSTRWTQSGSIYVTIDGEEIKTDATFNQYCPLLPDSDTHSVTGCSNTADSQILYYWLQKGYDLNLTVTSDDYYYLESTGDKAYYVSDNPQNGEGSLTEINRLLAQDTLESSLTNGDFIAALNFYCGVKNHSSYGSSTSTTYYLTTSHSGTNLAVFKNAGFDSYFVINQNNSIYFDGTVPNELGFSIIRENLDYGEIVGMSIPGHAVYIDGYKYNESTGEYEYHVNYGWGRYSSKTKWYTVSELEEIEIKQIKVDVSPDINVNVTNTDGNYYGGSVLRGVERINYIKNEKTAEFAFDESIAGETIKMESAACFTNDLVDLLFKDVSVDLQFTTSNGVESYANIDMNMNGGSISVNHRNSFLAISADQIDLAMNNSWIYTGHWTSGSDDIHNIMTNNSGYNIANFSTEFLESVSGYGVTVTDFKSDDTLTLTNNSAIFGNLSFKGGNDVITVETGSLIYGDIQSDPNSLDLNLVINNNIGNAMIVNNHSLADQDLYKATDGIIHVEIADNINSGTYILVDGITEDIMNDFSVVVDTGDETFTLNSANTEHGRYQLSFTDANLALTLTVQGVQIWKNDELILEDDTVYNETLQQNTSMFIWKNGTAHDTVVSYGGTMNVYNGGVASGTYISYGGIMNISSGGKANSTTISGGDLYISSGALAEKIKSNNGFTYIYSGGTANSMTVERNSYIYLSGGTANNTTQNAGSMYIYSGGTANSTTAGRNGFMFIYSGGTANNTTLLGGRLDVRSGGTANNIAADSNALISIKGVTNSAKLNSACYMDIYSGGTANSTTVNFSGSIDVNSSGTANYTKVNSGGVVRVDMGFVNSTTVNSNGYMLVYSGGTANYTTVNSFGVMTVGSNGTAKYTNLNHLASMSVSNGGTANSTTIYDEGRMYIMSEGKADYTTINRCGSMYLSGGTANYTTLNYEGRIHISSGGKANSTTVNDYGRINVSFGGTANYTIINKGYTYIYSGGKADYTTVNSNGWMVVSSGGEANNTTINSRGHMDVSFGGTANSTMINFNGDMWVLGTANYTTLSGGVMRVTSGAMAKYTSVYKGTVIVFGGSMYGVNLYSGAELNISGGKVEALFYNGAGTANVFSGGQLTSTTVNSSGVLNVYDGAKVTSAALKNGGTINYYGGTAYNVDLLYGGSMNIMSGAVRQGQIADKGMINVSNGGTASACITKSGGMMKVLSGGSADDTRLMTNGIMYVYSNGMATDTVTSYGARVYVCGGTVSGTHIQRGTVVSVYQGGSAAGNRVDYGSYLIVDSGARVSDTTVSSGGGLTVMAGAAASNNEIYGTLNCNNGGILLGETTIHSRANLAGSAVVTNNTEITFDVSGRSASAMQESYREAMLNSYYVARDADMNISVAADQDFGSYILANWALEAQKDTFTLTVDGTEVGTFSTTESLTYNGKTYSLYCFDDATNSKALTLQVSNANTGIWLEIDSGDFNGDGIEEALVLNGTDLLAQAEETLWLGTLSGTEEIASIADYNNDGTDDLLVHNTATDEMTAWLVKDGSTFGTLAIA